MSAPSFKELLDAGIEIFGLRCMTAEGDKYNYGDAFCSAISKDKNWIWVKFRGADETEYEPEDVLLCEGAGVFCDSQTNTWYRVVRNKGGSILLPPISLGLERLYPPEKRIDLTVPPGKPGDSADAIPTCNKPCKTCELEFAYLRKELAALKYPAQEEAKEPKGAVEELLEALEAEDGLRVAHCVNPDCVRIQKALARVKKERGL